MFKQFIQNFADSRIYLITSLWLFLIFFLLVAIMLFRMNKRHVEYMSNLPLKDDEDADVVETAGIREGNY
ncbi:MAG: hypothetical protein WBJ10_10485 [Daejeonella sp.]|uniref:hypothetical protein n=1 Tax=Daejeonella sp. TaxID=2805397 RepID=UPI003C75175D